MAQTAYRDPIDRLNRAVARPVDPLNGESREIGRVYHYPGWFAMHDRQKVALLRQLAEGYGSDAQMRFFTARLLQQSGVQPRDFAAQAACIHAFVQTSCYYTNEPGEQIQSPWRTLKERTGDCDDLALLIASMAHSVGLEWKYALAGKLPRGQMTRWIEGERWPNGADMFHIYVYLGWPPFNAQKWAAAEPTIRGIPLGYDVVDRGLPEHARQSVDLGGGAMHGYGDIPPIAQQAGTLPASIPVPVGEPAAPGVTAYFGKLWEMIDWKDVTNAVVQGVIVALAVPAALHWIKRKK